MTASPVFAFDDCRADDERVAQDLEDLARFRQVEAWERRVRQLSAFLGSQEARLFHRRRLIRNAMLLKPACTEAVAAQWVDGLIEHESRH